MSLIPQHFVPCSQTDPRWSSKTYADGKLTIGVAGCALVALTNLINIISGTTYTPVEVDEKLVKVGAYSGSLMYWVNVPKAFPLKFVYRDFNYSNVLVASYVYLLRIPVIVAVKTKFSPLHFVLYVGDTLMIDSQDGAVKSTSFYNTRIGDVRYIKS